MKEIIIRTLSGIVYTGLIIASLLTSEWFFIALMFIVNLLAANEYAQLRKYNNTSTKILWVFTTFVYLFILSAHLEYKIALRVLGVVVILTMLSDYLILRFKKLPERNYVSKRLSLASIYITTPLLLAVFSNWQLAGLYQYLPLILVVFILIWVNDTFAYLLGSAIGKHRIYAKISPKKSWEGFAGGLLGVLLAVFFISRFEPILSLAQWILLGILISVFALLGDFYESMLKRKAGVKDSGKILPGHGGILDRIDSFLFVSPVVFVYLRLVL